MSWKTETLSPPLTVVRSIAPEDLVVDQYVTISRRSFQMLREDEHDSTRSMWIERVAGIPSGSGYPYKVSRVAIPYVLVRDPDGSVQIFDLRLVQLVQLPNGFGEPAFQAFAKMKQDETGDDPDKPHT